MMRRNSTSRRVHTLSSDSIRSDEIAATDMALSRDGSRDWVSDILGFKQGFRHIEYQICRGLLMAREWARTGLAGPASADSWPLGAAKSIRQHCPGGLRQVKAAVTPAGQGAMGDETSL